MFQPDHNPPPSYLIPYLNAARQHGGGFRSLLWASPQSQAARFAALTRACKFHGKSVLDAGCGRADFLDYLEHVNQSPDHYVGLEAVAELADAADAKRHPQATILRADFVKDPLRLYVGADVVVFSGSLNTLSPEDFERTIKLAYEAATEAMVINFLCSPRLAGASHLAWHAIEDVSRLAATLSPDFGVIDDYLEGDATLVIRRVVPL
jgi:hypothetical protein